MARRRKHSAMKRAKTTTGTGTGNMTTNTGPVTAAFHVSTYSVPRPGRTERALVWGATGSDPPSKGGPCIIDIRDSLLRQHRQASLYFTSNGNKNERPSFEHNQALNTKQCQLTPCSLTTMHVDLPVDYACYTCVRLRVRVRVRACACACLQVAIQNAFRNSLLKCFTVEALAGSAAVSSSLNEMIGQAIISESRERV